MHGADSDDSHSFIYFMHQHFLDHVNINMDNVRYPQKQMQQIWMRSVNSMRRKSLMRAVWILQSPSIGDDGHIAFNEPKRRSILLPLHVVKMDDPAESRSAECKSIC